MHISSIYSMSSQHFKEIPIYLSYNRNRVNLQKKFFLCSQRYPYMDFLALFSIYFPHNLATCVDGAQIAHSSQHPTNYHRTSPLGLLQHSARREFNLKKTHLSASVLGMRRTITLICHRFNCAFSIAAYIKLVVIPVTNYNAPSYMVNQPKVYIV